MQAPLERKDLLAILPYGEDFLFLDRVESLTDAQIVASYRVPRDSSLLRAHFVDHPVMPGVLTGEGLGQAGAVLVLQLLDDREDKRLLAMKIREASFSGLARPGDTIVYRVELEKFGSRMAKVRGDASVDGRVIAKAELTLAVVARRDLEARPESSDFR